jgi:LmbE family N-acetylglucosaminyl deacetylase
MPSDPIEFPQFSPGDRLLVLAPHPDDETLATGCLIQRALATGAAVQVLFATDGDDNPWPQRWIEKRWRIGAAGRARWGARRRVEAVRALAILGDGAVSTRFLGLPDQGLTDRLMRDDAAESALAAAIAGFGPSHVAVPSLDDRHPDHSALRLIAEIALARSGTGCMRFAYLVHGEAASTARVADARALARKRAAFAAHETQWRLGARRFGRLVERPESFARVDAADRSMSSAVAHHGDRLLVPARVLQALGRHELLIVAFDASRVLRLRVRRRPGRRDPLVESGNGAVVEAVPLDGGLAIRCGAGWCGPVRACAKVERPWPRIVVFDRRGWYGIGDWFGPDRETRVDDAVAAARCS